MARYFCVLLLLLVYFRGTAQDTLILLNGKVVPSTGIEIKEDKVYYQSGGKSRKVSTDRVFSIVYPSGREKIIFEKDSLDPSDLSIEEMRMFIKGEQEADQYYKNDVNKIVSGAVGTASGLLTIYGLIIPPAYATFVAGKIPDISKHPVSNPDLRNNQAFREGYESRSRHNKVKNSLIFGFSGFAIGFAAYSIFIR